MPARVDACVPPSCGSRARTAGVLPLGSSRARRVCVRTAAEPRCRVGVSGSAPSFSPSSQGVTLTCVCQTSSSDTCSVLYVGNTSYPSSHHQTDRAAIPARVYAPHGLVGRRHGALCPSACSGWPLSSTGDDAPACRYLANTSAGVVAPVADSRVGGGVPLPLPLVAVTLSASSAAPVLSTGSSLTPLRHATNAARHS